jgi:hypothetical protein
MMDWHGDGEGTWRKVHCTRCPTPCENCRFGAFCETTPCGCECHKYP